MYGIDATSLLTLDQFWSLDINRKQLFWDSLPIVLPSTNNKSCEDVSFLASKVEDISTCKSSKALRECWWANPLVLLSNSSPAFALMRDQKFYCSVQDDLIAPWFYVSKLFCVFNFGGHLMIHITCLITCLVAISNDRLHCNEPSMDTYSGGLCIVNALVWIWFWCTVSIW